MGRAALAAAVISLVFCASAGASVTIIDSNDQPVARAQEWANTAKVPTPDATVRLIVTACPYSPYSPEEHATGCALPGTIWMDEAAITNPRNVFLHELGHEYDFSNLTDDQRDRFKALLGLTGPWQPAVADYWNAPIERFAEAYRLCAIGARPQNLGSAFGNRYLMPGDYGYNPPLAVHRVVCRLIRGA